jgi:hypothetical protein
MKTLSLALLITAGLALRLPAADVNVYAIIKAQLFTQTSTAAPANLPTGAFTFVSTIDRTSAAAVPTATLQRPNSTVTAFGPVPGAGSFAVAQQFNTEAALDAAFGSGAYLFTIDAVNDGTQTPTLNLPANSYPTTPNITNFTAAQNIDWTQPFTVNWTPFAGGNALDYIQLIITRSNGSELFSTPDFGQSGALTGAATSTTIPANTFVPGVRYTATLAFGNLVGFPDIFSYPGATGVTAFAKTTQFPITAPGTTPSLTIAKSATAGSYDLSWNADIGRSYDLRWTQDFVTWTPISVVVADQATETVTDLPGSGVLSRFYRLQEPP